MHYKEEKALRKESKILYAAADLINDLDDEMAADLRNHADMRLEVIAQYNGGRPEHLQRSTK